MYDNAPTLKSLNCTRRRLLALRVVTRDTTGVLLTTPSLGKDANARVTSLPVSLSTGWVQCLAIIFTSNAVG